MFEKLRLWGKKEEEPQARIEPTLGAEEMAAQVQAGAAAENDAPGIQVRNVGEAAQQSAAPIQEDDPVAAALASIKEEDAGAPVVPPSETTAPASMTVGPNFKQSSAAVSGVRTMPTSAEQVAPRAPLANENAAQRPMSLQQQEASHLEAKRPLVNTPAPSLEERLLGSAAIPPQMQDVSPKTSELRQDIDALIGKAEAAQKKQATEAPTGEVVSQPMHLEETLDSYLYAGGRLKEGDKEALRRIHKAALESDDPHETALKLYQQEFKNAYDADLQEAFLTSVALDEGKPQLEATEQNKQTNTADAQRVRPDGKIEPTLGMPPKLSETEARDMGDGRIEPPRLKIKRQPEDIEGEEIDDATLEKELGAAVASLLPNEKGAATQGERKVKGMILDTDPQVKLLKQQLNQGTLSREQYYREVAKLQATAPEVTLPADEATEITTQTQNIDSGDTQSEKTTRINSKPKGPVAQVTTPRVAENTTTEEGEKQTKQADDEVQEGELWSIKTKKPLYGAARTSATNAQIKRIEDIQSQEAVTRQTEGAPAEEAGVGEDEEAIGGGVEGAPARGGSEGSESTFLHLEMFTFSDAFTERVKTLLEKSTQEIDEDEAMDILDSLADALLRDNDAKFERQKNKLRELCGDAKTENGRSLIDALLFELQREILRNAVEQTEKRQTQEAAAQQREEGSYSGEQMDQILRAIVAAEQRGYERATETAKELTKLSVEKAEARGVGDTLRAIIGGAAVGAVSIGGAIAAAPTLGVAIGGLTIGTAAIAGGGLGIAVAGAAMAIGILNKDDKK